MPDPLFADPRLASLYDLVEGPRPDLDVYDTLVSELGATRVVDLGCGTGTLACRLAGRGLTVTGVDPAPASLDVARAKPGADAVEWILGGADAIPAGRADLVLMTGNVAQVFLTDAEWYGVLGDAARALAARGRLVFETRVPERRAWERWTREHTERTVDAGPAGEVTIWCDLLAVDLPLVSFRWSHRFARDGSVITSDSTLRFRALDEIHASLAANGLVVDEVRDAPDRPGLEHVVIASARAG